MKIFGFLSASQSWIPKVLLAGAIAVFLSSCIGAPTTRKGMVKDPQTGLMIGSNISHNFLIDSAFFREKRIKIRIRNQSGDPQFNLDGFQGQIEDAFRANGFEPTNGDFFSVLVDINVLYSGHAQTNLQEQFTFLGLGTGGILGSRSSSLSGPAVGLLAGATLGSIIGSFVTDDTYTIIAETNFAITNADHKSTSKKRITFSDSKVFDEEDDDDEDDRRLRIAKSYRTTIATFAGGRNTPQSAIAHMVRDRLARILGNFV